MAAERCYPKLVEELIKVKSDPNRADAAGETPLHCLAQSGSWCNACLRDRRLTVQALVDGQAEVDFANPRGRTPLHVATAKSDECAIIQVLLEEAADVNAVDLGGFTPLMWSAGRGRSNQVKALLAAEADPRLEANRGQTALLFAKTNQSAEVTNMIEAQLSLLGKNATRLESRTKQTLHPPFMGKVHKDYVPDLTSNAY
eukprot:TRINITY_DN20479_c1_g1_i3.p1 TRINITY_DN20479_c1_g1~~TRINITY_DN20479_c1_g1_i3.p1  ORF type:complete len:200 (+),score=37.33 TRINITY_DN20479_c1_g1_i3:229-828(+)